MNVLTMLQQLLCKWCHRSATWALGALGCIAHKWVQTMKPKVSVQASSVRGLTAYGDTANRLSDSVLMRFLGYGVD